MSNDTKQILAKAGLPSIDSLTGIIINEKLLMGLYYKYLDKYGVILLDVKKAWNHPEHRENIKRILRENGLEGKIDINKYVTGLYIKIPDDTSVPFPIYACFVLGSRGFIQRLVNIVDIGDNAEVIIAKGCSTIVFEGAHSAITAFRTGRNSKFTTIMIHNWAPSITVGAKTIGVVGEDSMYKSYYIKLSPVKSIGIGEEIHVMSRGKAEIHKATTAPKNTKVRESTTIHLEGEGSSGMIITRGIAGENGYLEKRLAIIAKAEKTRGHIECQGIVLGNAVFKTTPVLESYIEDAWLSHEASIGRIRGDQLFYLQTRGLTEDEAVQLIVTGFLSSTLEGLPQELRDYVESALNQFAGKGL